MAAPVHGATWMADLGDAIAPFELRYLCMPGTHDSGTYALRASADFAVDAPPCLQGWGLGPLNPLAKLVVNTWSVTQRQSVGEQLLSGARYLDFRVGKHKNGGLYVLHGQWGGRIEQELEAIAEFIQDHPRELLLLDFNHFYGLTDPDHDALTSLIYRHCGRDRMVARAHGPTVRVGECWARGETVVVFYQNRRIQEQNDKVWDPEQIDNPWWDTDQPADLVSKCDGHLLSTERPRGLHVTQWILSAQPKTVVKAVLSPLLGPHFKSLAQMSHTANLHLERWFRDTVLAECVCGPRETGHDERCQACGGTGAGCDDPERARSALLNIIISDHTPSSMVEFAVEVNRKKALVLARLPPGAAAAAAAT